MSISLAREWCKKGHLVRVITATPGANLVAGVPVLRNPSAREIWRATRWCDVCFHNNISLRWTWAPIIAFRPWVIAHQTWLTKADGRVGWQERLKRIVLRAGRSVAISHAMAAHLPVPVTVIPNAYDETVFRLPSDDEPRAEDLVFVGRFVSDKGGDVLIAAMASLGRRGIRPKLTMIGEGPDENQWRKQSEDAGLGAQLRWTGPLSGAALANELHRHSVMVVPSRWAEPFGIVALEGAASGCVVVGSRAGGLSEAIGPCGETFANGDVGALAEALGRMIRGEFVRSPAQIDAHLRTHRVGTIAKRYLGLFEEVLR